MSRCEMLIAFDRADRTYRAGEDVTGTVSVRVNRDVQCDGLQVEHFWQTHGRGNTDTGPKQTTVLFRGDWRAGATLSYPFRFRAPNGPPTYHGRYLNVDHYIHARGDIPWAIDPKLKEEYLLRPSGRAYGNLPRDRDRQQRLKRQISQLGVPIGLAMIIGGIIFIFPFGLLLIPLGCIVLLFALRKSLAERKLGKVKLRLGSTHVAPGGRVPVRLSLTPRRSSTLNRVTAKLVGAERCVSGSGTNRTTHTHKLYERTVTLARGGHVTAGQPIQLDAAVPIPETDAFSFSASDNDLIWSLEVRIDIPLWPDWVEKRVVTVRPPAEAELVEEPARKPVPADRFAAEPPVDVQQPEAEPVPAAVFSAGAATFAVEDAEPAGPEDSLTTEVSADQPTVTAPPVAEPAAPPAADSALMEVIDRLASARPYGTERQQIIEARADESFRCAVEIDSVDRTYSYIPDKRFRRGRTVTGVIPGTDCKVSVQLPEDRNAELDALMPGATFQTTCRLIKWNTIHDRLEMREA